VSDETDRLAEKAAWEKREADLVGIRIAELGETPIRGQFDAAHLKAVHAYIFQDLPHHQPGVTRGNTEHWVKHRELEGRSASHVVRYVHKDVEQRIAEILREFGGAGALRSLNLDQAASRIANLYGDLDHAHGFHEGNSRTLREFTRELAAEAGLRLDWTGTGVGTQERNELYIARDVAVLERAYPDLTPERAMTTDDRREYEASFVLDRLRRAMGENSLHALIRARLTPMP
jgi:cell filamentation protein